MKVERQYRENPVVDRFARLIPNPVDRLRFLQRVAGPPTLLPQGMARRSRLRLASLALLLLPAPLLLTRATGDVRHPAVTPASKPVATPSPDAERVPQVWMVEQQRDFEVYSNGLRIETQHSVSNRPRSYVAFFNTIGSQREEAGSQPVGIVFHTTESRQAPFEANANTRLNRLSQSIVEYVRQKRAYNFLIDRFGRVYRIVNEADAANHAGYSVWSDGNRLYLNLNDSFLGVSFEAETHPGQSEASVSEAQIRSAAVLTEMLRSRYRIAARNCITHAQVSVNPTNLRIGYHTDWASSFPFEKLGLPDNYQLALPSVWACGFGHDASFLAAAGSRMATGVEAAEARLERDAASFNKPAAAYRAELGREYRRNLDRLRHREAPAGE
jgi:hypothetical protein